MSLQNCIDALKAKHADLDRALKEESRRPTRDSMTLAEMKRKKLAIKDESTRMGAM